MTNTRNLLVDNAQNSRVDDVKLQDLDWGSWTTDGAFGQIFLLVKHKRFRSWHKVYCRKSDYPRLAVRFGRLHWVVEVE